MVGRFEMVELAAAATTTTGAPNGDASYGGWALLVSLFALAASIGAYVLPHYRRPKLSLRPDSSCEHSHVEGDAVPYFRALVHNAKGKRSAKHARVVHDGHKLIDDRRYTRIGSPFLAWPSTFGQESAFYADVVFADAERPVGIGRFTRVKLDSDGKLVRAFPSADAPVIHFPSDPQATWYLHLELGKWSVTDERDWLAPGTWSIRLLLGADDGDAQAYIMTVGWRGDETDGEAVLSAALDSVRIAKD